MRNQNYLKSEKNASSKKIFKARRRAGINAHRWHRHQSSLVIALIILRHAPSSIARDHHYLLRGYSTHLMHPKQTIIQERFPLKHWAICTRIGCDTLDSAELFGRQQQWWKRETMVDPLTDGSCSAIIPASSALFQWHHPWSAFSGKLPFLYFSLPSNKPTPFARPILRCLLLPRRLLLRDLSSWQLPLPTRIQIATPKIQRLEKNHEI